MEVILSCSKDEMMHDNKSPSIYGCYHVSPHALSLSFISTFPLTDSFLNETLVFVSIGSYWKTCSMSNPGKNTGSFPFVPLFLLFSASFLLLRCAATLDLFATFNKMQKNENTTVINNNMKKDKHVLQQQREWMFVLLCVLYDWPVECVEHFNSDQHRQCHGRGVAWFKHFTVYALEHGVVLSTLHEVPLQRERQTGTQCLCLWVWPCHQNPCDLLW